MADALRELLERATKLGVVIPDDRERIFSSFLNAPPTADQAENPNAVVSPAQAAERLHKLGALTRHQADAFARNRVEDLVFGPYVVEEELGQGGMGCVYKAVHPLLKRTAAIKTIRANLFKNKEAVNRFLREVEVVGRMSHPNVVSALHADRRGDEYYLVMEFIEGMTLHDFVTGFGPMSAAQAGYCVIGAARGLHYAHQRGVVHRDIKPDNLMLTKDRVIKILDLGLARIAEADNLTHSGAVMGTFDYMAPEQWEDSRHVDGRADVYSLGCSLYFLCAGRRIFGDQQTIQAKMMAHLRSPSPSLREARPDLPPRLDAIYRKMTAKRPEDRFASMEEVIHALERDLPEAARESSIDWPNLESARATRLSSDSDLAVDPRLEPDPVKKDERDGGDDRSVRLVLIGYERWMGASGGIIAGSAVFWVGGVGWSAIQIITHAKSQTEVWVAVFSFLVLSSVGAAFFPIGLGLALGNIAARASAIGAWIAAIPFAFAFLVFSTGYAAASWPYRVVWAVISVAFVMMAVGSLRLLFSEKGRRVFSESYRATRKRTPWIAIGGGWTMIASMLTWAAILFSLFWI